MALRDAAIVGYAETKIVEKSRPRHLGNGRGDSRNAARQDRLREKGDRRADPFVLDDRRGQSVLVADDRRPARARTRLLPDRRYRRLLADGRAGARLRGDRRRPRARRCCASTPMRRRPRTTASARGFEREWTRAGRLSRPARRIRPPQQALRTSVRSRLCDARQARGGAARPRRAQRPRLRETAQADHGRRLSQLAHDRRSDPPARQRDGVRRRQRPDRHQREERQGARHHKIRRAARLWRAHQLPRRRRTSSM